MGQITKEFAENLLKRTAAGQHINTTVWEETQLVNAWLALHGYKTWPGMPCKCRGEITVEVGPAKVTAPDDIPRTE